MDGAAEYDHVRAKHLFHYCDGNGGCLIDNKQFCLSQLSIVLRLDVLDSLPVVFEHVHTDDCIVEVWISRL